MMRMPIVVVFALVMGACSFGGSSGNGGGGGGGGGDDGVDASIPVCGDGTCAASEVNNCPQDCGGGGSGGGNAVCGNGQCETTKGESAASCPSDCGGGGGGAVCGNGTCEATESSTSCPSDCGGGGGGGSLDCNDQNVQIACFTCILTNQCTGVDPTSCATCLGGMGGGLGCVGGVPNGVCDPGEDANNCPFDCM